MLAFDFINPPERVGLLVVETTSLCSLRCAGCLRTIRRALGNWTDRHMSAARFQRIVDHSPPADQICVQGVGEPTLNPELLEIVSIAKRSGKYNAIFFSTHGLARDVAYFQALLDAGLTWFRVSVDSFDPENAERLREGTDVVKLQNRIRSFAERQFPFGISITISKHNMKEIPNILEILNGIAEIHRFDAAMHNLIYRHDEENPSAVDYSNWVLDYADIRWISGKLPEWRSRFPNLNVIYDPSYDGMGDIGICDAPRTEPWVGVDGAWGVCCHSADTSVLGYTSIESLPFDQAWRSEKAQRFLRSYATESPPLCDACPRNCGRFSSENAITP